MPGDRKKSFSEKRSRLDDDAVEQAKAGILHGVGYKRPPRATQFRRGHSGNPNGRPRAPKVEGLTLGDQPLLRAILARAEKRVRIREGDKVTEVTTREALVESIIAAALKGNARSQGLSQDMFHRADLQAAIDLRNRGEFGSWLKDVQSARLKAANDAGNNASDVLPHPDDIILDDQVGYRIVGPVDEEDQKELQENIAYRDALLMQKVLDERIGYPQSDYDDDGAGLSGALVMAFLLERTMPERFRLSTTDIIMKQMTYDRMTLRELLKESYRTWQSLGHRIRRGTQFPNRRDLTRWLSVSFALISDMVKRQNEGEPIGQQELEERVGALLYDLKQLR